MGFEEKEFSATRLAAILKGSLGCENVRTVFNLIYQA
jgi:hypothetical protein